MTDTAQTTPKRVKTGLVRPVMAAGLKLDKDQKDLAKRIEVADKLAEADRRAVLEVMNGGLDAHYRAEAAHEIAEAEKAIEDPSYKRQPFGETPPDVRRLMKLAEASRSVAQRFHHQFDRELDYADLDRQIQDRWRQEVEWDSEVDPESLTLKEARKLEAKAEETRSALLDLSMKLARVEAENEAERKAHRKAQRDAGRPLSIHSLREEWRSKDTGTASE